ncbi:MAG: iron hydrogenase small subunit [Clostridia bacterium]|nr:iron hydrogenase small subunit [Clostridia bacterium]
MIEKSINLIIDNINVCVPEGTTILEAARKANIDIPTLCFLKEINEIGDCRMCIVEVEGRRGFATSCITKAEEGMVVHTNSSAIIQARRTILDLIISNHHMECLTCVRDGNCELQDLAKKFNMKEIMFDGEKIDYEIDDKSPSIVKDLNKCVLCRRCVGACKKVQEIGAIDSMNRGFESCVSTANGLSLNDVDCTFCGQCIEACPVGALREKDNTEEVWAKIRDDEVYTVVQTAPAVRAALGEEFGMPIGTDVEGKMVSALRAIGFNKVFDTNTGADFTIMEEANEFIERIQNGGVMPMMTSCCPAWIRFAEKNFPDQLDHLSSCKSPHEMFGAVIKSYYAQKFNIPAEKVFVVSVMPCVAKKYEAVRPEMENDGLRNVDAVITTRELARMIKQANIDFVEIEDSKFDDPMGEATGAAAIFGTTGGVMEAALRTAADALEGRDIGEVNYEAVRGEAGIKRATVNIAGRAIRVVVASGLKNARKIMNEIKDGKADYDFVEIMACPGGCVMGGGQPIKSSKIRSKVDVRKQRANSLYSIDAKSAIRKSHKNPVVQEIYNEFFEKPGAEKAHKYLHTEYSKQNKYFM